MGFRHRLALFLVVTLASVQLFTAIFAYGYLRERLRAKAEADLIASSGVFVRQLALLSERVADDVKTLSLDYALRQAIAEHQYGTEFSALRNHGRRVGATRMMLVGMDGTISADTGAAGVTGNRFYFSDLLGDAAASGERTSFVTLKGRVYWMVVVPVRAPLPIAFIAACIPIDNALLETLRGLSSVPRSIALATKDAKGRWISVARTANGPSEAALMDALHPAPGSRLIADRENNEFLTVTTKLATASNSDPVIAVLGYPLDEAFAAYRAIVVPVLIALAAALLAAVAGAFMVVRTVTRPLELLAQAARRIESGDYTPPPKLPHRDELGDLSGALIAMTHSIAARESALTAAFDATELARKEAVHANEAKSQFLANMSHELRTPLNAIVGFGEMLHEQVLGPIGIARYREYARDIVESGQHLLRLVSRMLDLAEIEAGKLELAREPIEPASLVRQAVGSLHQMAERAGVQIAVSVEIEGVEVHGDLPKLRQALTSIVHNAIKFTPPGETILVSARREVGLLVVSIEDHGIGMRAEDAAVVIRPFHRLRSALDGQHQGAGLGLPFAKVIFELHGGSLAIRTAPGLGTTVEVRLPLAGANLSTAA